MSAPGETRTTSASPAESALRALVRLLARQAAREFVDNDDQKQPDSRRETRR